MFLKLLWPVLLIVAVAALYPLVIRPRLKVRFSETYLHIDGFWARLRARLYAFRSYVATWFATLAIALPYIVEAILPVDLSWLVGADWASAIGGLLAAYLAINRAYATKPDREEA